MRIRAGILFVFLSFSTIVSAKSFYVSPTGSDSNPGTIERPWSTWGKAFNSSLVSPGDTVFFRGGIYRMTVTNGSGYNVTRSGTISKPVCFFSFREEVPILDCNNVVPSGSINFGIRVHDDLRYVHFKGLTIRNVWSVRMGVECIAWRFEHSTDVTIENCTIYNVHGIAFENWGAYNTYYVNCDAYNCCDSLAVPGLTGGRGTGFASLNTSLKEPRAGSTYYRGCRAWRCSDQGFSFYNSHYVEVDGCWSFCNGALETGDGHGFKLGFTPGGASLPVQRRIVNCMAAFNRATGITTNEGSAYPSQNMEIFNNTIYHTGFYEAYPWGYGIWVDKTTSQVSDELKRIFKNNLVYKNQSGPVFLGRSASYTHSGNSWDINVTITDADFISVDSAGISGPRNNDGSLPVLNFMKLATGSALIDKGEDVGLRFNGAKPDLGAFEHGPVIPGKKPVSGITIEGEGGARAITENGGKLRLIAEVLPSDATVKTVTWSVKEGAAFATVSPANGLVTAVKNGIVTIWAVANDGSGVYGSYTITISNQKETGQLNSPPVIMLNYSSDVYSGFIGRIDAGGSYDADHDNLNFTWETSGNIPVSARTGSSIEYLAPVSRSPQLFEFILIVSDGKETRSQVIPIKIVPYEPHLKEADISGVESSSYQKPNYPYNIFDRKPETMWAAEGDNQWILVTLRQPFNIHHIRISFSLMQVRTYRFDILGSNDKITWEPILKKSVSCEFSGDIQLFEFPFSAKGREFSFIKLVGHGNSSDLWNCISELRIYGINIHDPGLTKPTVTIYPNPSTGDSITIRIDDPQIKPDFLEIVDLSGVVLFKSELSPERRFFSFGIKLKKGIYILELKSDRMILFAQKIIIDNPF